MMALFISIRTERNETVSVEWHIGQEVPKILKRVVTFQADGHELELILDALRSTTPKQNGWIGD